MVPSISLQDVPDDVLRDRLRSLAGLERRSLASQLRHLGEVQRRDASAKWGYPSMFYYCTQELKFSEAAAYKRITAARKSLECPMILELVERGDMNLEGILILAPHLRGNDTTLLERAQGKKAPALQALVAEIAPRPDVRDSVMRLPDGPVPGPETEQAGTPAPSKPSPTPLPAPSPARVEMLSPGRMHLGLTISDSLWEKIKRARGLLWHKQPTGKLEHLLDELVEFYLKAKDPVRRAQRREVRRQAGRVGQKKTIPSRPAVPVAVRDAVFLRDAGRCAFISEDGRACGSTGSLEIDHVHPKALGGSDSPSNLRVLCRAHNQFAARRLLGAGAVGPHRRG